MLAVDEFIEAETSKMNWFDKMGMNYPKVKTTKYLSFPLAGKTFSSETVIRPSLINKSLTVVYLFFLSLLALALANASSNGLPFAASRIGFAFIAIAGFIVVRNAFFHPKYIFEIKLSTKGIEIKNAKLLWGEVAETCIMSRREGKSTNYYLVIFTKTKAIMKYDLFSFSIADRKLATLIEYYKTSTNASK